MTIMATASRVVIVDDRSDPELAMAWARKLNPGAVDFRVEARDEVTRIVPVMAGEVSA